MSDNPYQSPSSQSQIVGVKSGSREDLRSEAQHQKAILVSILIKKRASYKKEGCWLVLSGDRD